MEKRKAVSKVVTKADVKAAGSAVSKVGWWVAKKAAKWEDERE